MNPESTFQDHFSDTARDYARYRPRYPPALFAFLASLCARREAAWDCATGSGQAASGLAAFFDVVVATDASSQQIENAVPHRSVRYGVAPAEASGLESESVDLVTIAQALHWLDVPRFFQEVRRVGRPDGVFAAWCYYRLQVDPAVDAVVRRYHDEIVGPYWPAERALVARGYTSLPFPFHPIRSPDFSIEECWDLEDLLGYLATWSATRRFRAATGEDPLPRIRADLHDAWGDPRRRRTVTWPLEMRVGRL